MGKQTDRLVLLASRAAKIEKVLNRLALNNRRVGKRIQLSLLLTKALVARSITTTPRIGSSSFSHGRRNIYSNNTWTSTTAKRTPPHSHPQGTLLSQLLVKWKPCLDFIPWIYRLIFLTRLPLPFPPSSHPSHMQWLHMLPAQLHLPTSQHLGLHPPPPRL